MWQTNLKEKDQKKRKNKRGQLPLLSIICRFRDDDGTSRSWGGKGDGTCGADDWKGWGSEGGEAHLVYNFISLAPPARYDVRREWRRTGATPTCVCLYMTLSTFPLAPSRPRRPRPRRSSCRPRIFVWECPSTLYSVTVRRGIAGAGHRVAREINPLAYTKERHLQVFRIFLHSLYEPIMLSCWHVRIDQEGSATFHDGFSSFIFKMLQGMTIKDHALYRSCFLYWKLDVYSEWWRWDRVMWHFYILIMWEDVMDCFLNLRKISKQF